MGASACGGASLEAVKSCIFVEAVFVEFTRHERCGKDAVFNTVPALVEGSRLELVVSCSRDVVLTFRLPFSWVSVAAHVPGALV